MIKLTDNELKCVYGGTPATIISAIVKGGQLIFDLGKSLGSAIRRALSGKYC